MFSATVRRSPFWSIALPLIPPAVGVIWTTFRLIEMPDAVAFPPWHPEQMLKSFLPPQFDQLSDHRMIDRPAVAEAKAFVARLRADWQSDRTEYLTLYRSVGGRTEVEQFGSLDQLFGRVQTLLLEDTTYLLGPVTVRLDRSNGRVEIVTAPRIVTIH